jgi:hypothetical protein
LFLSNCEGTANCEKMLGQNHFAKPNQLVLTFSSSNFHLQGHIPSTSGVALSINNCATCCSNTWGTGGMDAAVHTSWIEVINFNLVWVSISYVMDLGVAGEFVLANIMTKVTPLLQNRNSGCIIQIQKFWAECDVHIYTCCGNLMKWVGNLHRWCICFCNCNTSTLLLRIWQIHCPCVGV